MSAAETYALPNGRTIRSRREQMIVWSIVAGLIGAAFAAGLYFGITQVNWGIFWLKPHWDGLFKATWWATYRHEAFRDIPEPALATLGVYTMLAKPKYWAKKVPAWRVAVTPPLIVVLTFALGVLGTYLLNFAPWDHSHKVESVLQWQNVGDLVLGFGIGHLMRYIWQPVGATIQGRLLEPRADKAANAHKVPVWVKYPLSPPQIRERFSSLYVASKAVKGNLYESHPVRVWLISAGVLVFLAVTLLGFYGHYWVGAGHPAYFFHTTSKGF